MIRKKTASMLLVLLVFLVACDGDNGPPPTELVIITPATTQVNGEETVNYPATIAALEATNSALSGQIETLQAPSVNISPTEDRPLASPTATIDILPTETLRPSNFPTARAEIISVVEQVFEGGRMIWFRDTRTVAVLVGDEVDPVQGDWFCFEDSFVEGETEFLPTLQPPADVSTNSAWPDARIQQPIRGFGKIWRENPDLRERLGWALSAEYEHSAVKEYVAGGRLVNGEYVPGPGEYRVQSFFDSATIILYESEVNSACPSGTWRLRYPSN